jgi:hypothetical protein
LASKWWNSVRSVTPAAWAGDTNDPDRVRALETWFGLR